MNTLLSRFLHYLTFHTRSDATNPACPSSEGQRLFARALCDEMTQMGLSQVTLDEHGYLTACLPGNQPDAPAIGLIAHMDTADYEAECVVPQIVEHYQGGDICLGKGDEVLAIRQYRFLKNYLGQDLITTDGTTLLGADDKAGIAEILTAVEYLQAHPEIPRGDVWVGFTPDEEIGRGADRFPLDRFPAKWAYTVDGGELGELECENFNAASATVRITGNNVHPGTAKGSMINSQTLAARFHAAMPAEQTPECTQGYEGFFHLARMEGTVEETTLHYLIRDFDDDCFAARKAQLKERVASLQLDAPKARITLEIVDNYRNMHSQIAPHPHIVELAKAAMEAADVVPKITPIRGGTDGARLSFMGLPCPNLFTGGHNFHGKHEFIPLQSMEKAVATLVALVRLTSAWRAE
ncbi:peptidase T [Aeromonas caviae]|jgi:tripeptide aminopeptidase|uniref:Peptidase T n=1 Tax=Aeromonas caviae TaxID=648 RepID=A0AAW9EV14_AERCA|nr:MULTISPECIES: peptidase T [Aeromonas]PZR02015.1 MAG: peptidase T [Aeromonas media]AUV18242.1 peptidase T [Aeromonas sp. ASNIH7]MBL0552530.1 peptidase T [Aeromonas caviae]MCE9863988.1 peptidase T [Aeromonas caviae]MDH0027313.1 peptidase T [Aeromonas caviae]